MKIKVVEVESKSELGTDTAGELEMVRVGNNLIINNGGRSLPF